ncbi:hypothetical protein [Nocardia carnea]|uniref:hypothetical protein n=1 Tax=Nocardia carnea TaxID=37328 RepID=UPI0024539830|nr:hypothetical protein [Nocardia carnea]
MATQLLFGEFRRERCGEISAPARFGRAGAFLCVLAAAVTAAVLGTPPAAATVTQVSVTPDLNVGIRTDYGTGCSYTLMARLSEAVTPVTFYDNGVAIATVPPAGGGLALLDWVPAYEGDHTLQAAQPGGSPAPSVQVFVGRGAHIGYACWVI